MTDSSTTAVRKYYERLGSRLGYNLVMGGSKHFGYYDENHRTERQAQQRILEKFWKLLDAKPGMKILDAGCGQGLVAVKTAMETGASVDGITVVPFEVTASKKLARARGVDDLTNFLLQDYSTLKGKPRYDRIYTFETLSHAPDVQKVVNNFMHVLKPGGKIVCVEYEADYTGMSKSEEKIIKLAMDKAAIHGAWQFGIGQFVRKLQTAGFVDINEYDWTQACLPSFQRLRRIARPVRAIANVLHMQQHMVNTVVAHHYADMAEQKRFWFKAYSARKLT